MLTSNRHQINIKKKMTTDAFEEKLFLQHQNERVNSVVIPRLRKKYSYEWEKIHENEDPFIWLDTRLDLNREKIFSLWKNDFDLKEYLHFTDYKHIHYVIDEEENKGMCVPFLLEIEYICGIIDRGENEDRNHYFKSSAFLQTGYIHEIFSQIEDKMITDLGIDYNTIMDSGKFEINPSKKLPINQIVYLKNVVVAFEKVEKITVRRREKNKIVARIISGEILLNKNQ